MRHAASEVGVKLTTLKQEVSQRWYGLSLSTWGHQSGAISQVMYSPPSSCGSLTLSSPHSSWIPLWRVTILQGIPESLLSVQALLSVFQGCDNPRKKLMCFCCCLVLCPGGSRVTLKSCHTRFQRGEEQGEVNGCFLKSFFCLGLWRRTCGECWCEAAQLQLACLHTHRHRHTLLQTVKVHYHFPVSFYPPAKQLHGL